MINSAITYSPEVLSNRQSFGFGENITSTLQYFKRNFIKLNKTITKVSAGSLIGDVFLILSSPAENQKGGEVTNGI